MEVKSLSLSNEELVILNYNLDILSNISNIGIQESNSQLVLEILNLSFHILPLFTVRQNIEKVSRVTINSNILKSNKRIKNIEYLTYPKPEFVKTYGRCNLISNSIFYGSFSSINSLNEISPKNGSLITISTWENISKKEMEIFPLFYSQPTRENFYNANSEELVKLFEGNLINYETETKKYIIRIMKFLSNEFAKNIDNGNHFNYLISAYISNKLLNQTPEKNIDAIKYPGVQSDLSFENMAIKPSTFDKTFKIVEVKECIRMNNTIETISICREFNSNGDINWDKQIQPNLNKPLTWYIKEYNLELN